MSAIIKISILADAANAIKGFNETGDHAESMGSRLKGAAKHVAGMAIASIGVGTVVEAFKTGVDEAGAFQEATNQTNAALKTNANLHGLNAAAVQQASAALETLTGAKIDENQATLVQDKFIRSGIANQKNLQDALKVSSDVALGSGKDIDSVSTALSKALADPAKAQGVLAKAGVILSKSQQDAITTLAKTGDTAGAQALVMTDLESHYKGASEAAGTGFTADVGRAKDALSDAERDITTAVMPTLGSLAASFAKDLPGAVDTLKSAFKAMGDVVGPVVQFFKDHEAIAKTLAATILVLVAAIEAHSVAVAISNAATKIWAVMQGIASAASAVWTGIQWLLDAAIAASGIGLIVIGIVALIAVIVLIATKTTWFQTIWRVVWDFVKSQLLFFWDVAKSIGAWFAGPFANFFVSGFNIVKNFITGLVTWISDKVVAIVGFFMSIPGKVASVGSKILSTISGGIAGIVSYVDGRVAAVVALFTGLPGKVASVGKDLVNGLVNGIANAWHFVTDKVNSLIDLIPSGVRHILGMSSPSKVMADIGANITLGLAGGIVGKIGAVDKAMGRISTAVTSGVKGDATVDIGLVGQRNAAAASGVINVTVNVPPVADPAEVGRQVVKAIKAHSAQTGRQFLVGAV